MLKTWFRQRKQKNLITQGTLKALQGQYDAAIRLLTQALESDPQNEDALLHRGNAYLNNGHAAEAIADFGLLLHLNPRSELGLYNRALAYLSQGAIEQALADVSQAVAIAPDDGENYLLRCALYSELNQLDEALDDASRAIELGQEERGYANRAVVEENRGETAKAVSDWGQVIALNPKNGEAYVRRGLLQIKIGQREQAQADLRRGKKLWKEMSSDWDAKVKQALKNL